MLTVARALMSNPEFLLIDEASQGLAPVIIRDLMLKIKELKNQRQLTVFMTEQNFNQAVKIADRVISSFMAKSNLKGIIKSNYLRMKWLRDIILDPIKGRLSCLW